MQKSEHVCTFFLLCYIAMSHNTDMPRGNSGRIVLEVDPNEKQDLYDALGRDGLTLKDWFLSQARNYLQNRNQTEMFLMVAEPQAQFGAKRKKAQ